MMTVIMPLCGLGSRFTAAGLHGPKPLLPIAGVRMIDWALACLPPNAQVIAPCRKADLAILAQIDDDARVHLSPVSGPTEGAACTVLAAAVGLPPNQPVLVLNCDQYFVADLLGLECTAVAEGWDGYVLTFSATDARWSYVAEDAEGWVQRVVEKMPISTRATVGAYWFRRAGDLVWACATAIAEDQRTLGEFYLAPTINNLLRRKQRIKAVPVQAFYGLGTPEDVTRFANLAPTLDAARRSVPARETHERA